MANDISQPNAYLAFKNSNGQLSTFLLWVMEYEQPHAMQGSSHQSFGYKRYYPKSYAPGKITVKGRLPDMNQQNQLGEFIREHQRLTLSKAGASNLNSNPIVLMNFGIPKDGFSVAGLIPTFRAERRRYNPGPEYTFDFEVIRDRNSTNSEITPASALRSWWSGEVIDSSTGNPTEALEQQLNQGDIIAAPDLDNVGGGR